MKIYMEKLKVILLKKSYSYISINNKYIYIEILQKWGLVIL